MSAMPDSLVATAEAKSSPRAFIRFTPLGVFVPTGTEFVARSPEGPGNNAPSPRVISGWCDTLPLPGRSQRLRDLRRAAPLVTLTSDRCLRPRLQPQHSDARAAPEMATTENGTRSPDEGNVRSAHPRSNPVP